MTLQTKCTLNAPLPFVRQALSSLEPGRALDVACGSGRHLAALTSAGWQVTGVDRDAAALQRAAEAAPDATLLCLDVEGPAERGSSPFEPAWRGRFELVVTTFFLFRPLVPFLAQTLAPGGHWLLETFHVDNHQKNGRPRRAAFCLQPGEAAALAEQAGLRIVEQAEGLHDGTYTSRLLAQRPG